MQSTHAGIATASAIGLLLLAQVHLAAAAVRVCLPFPTRDAAPCTAVLNTGSAPGTFECVYGNTAAGCMTLVSNNGADLVRFGGEELYDANALFNLVPYVAESYSATGQGEDSQVSYFSVAVVRKELCDTLGDNAKFSALRGLKSCHTGYRRTAGWVLPMGYLIENNIMPVVDRNPDVQQDAETVASFFGDVCAPRTTKDGPLPGGRPWSEMCTACRGDCSADVVKEPYNDYSGALRCMMEGAGDVAWVKHTTPLDFAKDGLDVQPWSSLNKSDMALMCPGAGGCQPVENWDGCNIARAAAHAFVGRPGYTSNPETSAAIQRLAAANETWLTAMKTLDSAAGASILQSSAVGLRVVPNNDFAAHYGAGAIRSVKAIRALQVPTVNFCTASGAEQGFCLTATQIMNRKNLGVTFGCVQKESEHSCLQAISRSEADIRAFDGADQYDGLTNYNLKAIVAEDYGNGDGVAGTEYYAVAVVSKDVCSNTIAFKDLKGKRSCSTGYQRTAGWSMPLGLLINNGIMQIVRNDANVEDEAESWASFFSSTCAARVSATGPLSTANGGAKWDPLCTNCQGDCSGDASKEGYFDYSGALRCLMENKGDVAFMKHTTPLDFARDGRTPQPWSTKDMADLRFLCPSGGCARLNQPQACNVARVPAHAVMVRVSYPDTAILKSALVTISTDAEFAGLVFNGTSNPSSYLFKPATRTLVGIDDDTRTFLGNALSVFQGLATMNNGGNPSGTTIVSDSQSTSGDGGGSSLSAGAAAGIAIGCAVAGAIIAALIIILVQKRRRSNFEKFGNDMNTHVNLSSGKV